MPKTAPTMLDAPLYQSLYQKGVVGGFVVLCLLLAYLMGVVWWQLGIVLVLAIGLIYSSLFAPTPIHLVQLPPKQGDDSHWQLLMATAQGEQVWQGRLLSVHSFGLGVAMRFEIDEPLNIILKTVVYFDQLDDDDVRKLKMAIRFL